MAAQLQVTWIRNTENTWCGLHAVNLAHNHLNNVSGVYLIWHAGPTPRYVRVGQGNIRDRLTHHRTDTAINAYRNLGLLVTWASVPDNHLDGVEAYLANQCNPLVGERFPNVVPISVNLPSRE